MCLHGELPVSRTWRCRTVHSLSVLGGPYQWCHKLSTVHHWRVLEYSRSKRSWRVMHISWHLLRAVQTKNLMEDTEGGKWKITINSGIWGEGGCSLSISFNFTFRWCRPTDMAKIMRWNGDLKRCLKIKMRIGISLKILCKLSVGATFCTPG
jgi:hypothetical protein